MQFEEKTAGPTKTRGARIKTSVHQCRFKKAMGHFDLVQSDFGVRVWGAGCRDLGVFAESAENRRPITNN